MTRLYCTRCESRNVRKVNHRDGCVQWCCMDCGATDWFGEDKG